MVTIIRTLKEKVRAAVIAVLTDGASISLGNTNICKSMLTDYRRKSGSLLVAQ